MLFKFNSIPSHGYVMVTLLNGKSINVPGLVLSSKRVVISSGLNSCS